MDFIFQSGEFYSEHNSICHDLFVTVFGGLIITFLLFAINEWIIPKRNITGKWIVKMTIENTTYRKFKGLAIEYEFHLLQKGYEIVGTGEKIKDIYIDGSSYTFERIKRVRNSINGFMDRKYLSPTKVYFNVIENGRTRSTSSTFDMTLIDKDHMSGTFISTAADARGTISLTRG